MRARALTTSILCIFALGAGAASATAAPKKAQKAQTPELPAAPTDPSAPTTTPGGGAAYGVDPTQTPEMPEAVVVDGLAYPPAEAPIEVKQAIWAGNEIVGKPYKYGGGHARLRDSGYDCSGTVSYALIGGGLLEGTPLDSSSFMKWGKPGAGEWVTVYTNPGHAYVVIAGLRLDTSAAGDPSGNKGPQWRPTLRRTKGFKARHPEGF